MSRDDVGYVWVINGSVNSLLINNRKLRETMKVRDHQIVNRIEKVQETSRFHRVISTGWRPAYEISNRKPHREVGTKATTATQHHQTVRRIEKTKKTSRFHGIGRKKKDDDVRTRSSGREPCREDTQNVSNPQDRRYRATTCARYPRTVGYVQLDPSWGAV